VLDPTPDPFGRIAEFYENLIQRYGHDPRACDYGHPESQRTKFRVLSEAIPVKNRSVLDVGCGFADFACYLRERFPGVRYCGIDLTSSMVTEARRLNPGIDVRVNNILDAKFDTYFDLVTANGIFYLLGEHAPAVMEKMIDRMYMLSSCAVAFNSLSAWAEDKESGEFYADPLRVVDYCRRLTPWVVLRHDYHPRDFTVYMYKAGRK
jgi:SAM-dependent methyltransferase